MDESSLWPIYGGLFVAALASSLHCIGMCGPILVGFSKGFATLSVEGRAVGGAKRARAAAADFVWYHAGRLWTYGTLGWLAGWLGRGVVRGSEMVGWQRVGSAAIGVAVVVSGVALLGVFPRLRRRHGHTWAITRVVNKPCASALEPSPSGRGQGEGSASVFQTPSQHGDSNGKMRGALTPTLSQRARGPETDAHDLSRIRIKPSRIRQRIETFRGMIGSTAGAAVRALTTSGGWSSRLVLGMVMGLLPCGLVYAMLLTVAGLPTPLHSALGMIVFGLGTLPGLSAALLASSWLPAWARAGGSRLAAACVIAGGAWMIGRAILVTSATCCAH